MQFDELSSALSFNALLPQASAPLAATAAPAAAANGGAKASKKAAPKHAPTASPAAAAVPAGPVKRDDSGPLPELIGNKNFPGCEARGKFYVTTAISYTNGARLEAAVELQRALGGELPSALGAQICTLCAPVRSPA